MPADPVLVTRAMLLADDAVGPLVSTRIYQDRAPRPIARPYLIIQRITGDHLRGLGGPHGIAQFDLQIDAVADTAQARDELCEAVRLALDGQLGSFGSGATAALVQHLEVGEGLSFYEQPEDGGDAGVYRRVLEISITIDVAV